MHCRPCVIETGIWFRSRFNFNEAFFQFETVLTFWLPITGVNAGVIAGGSWRGADIRLTVWWFGTSAVCNRKAWSVLIVVTKTDASLLGSIGEFFGCPILALRLLVLIRSSGQFVHLCVRVCDGSSWRVLLARTESSPSNFCGWTSSVFGCYLCWRNVCHVVTSLYSTAKSSKWLMSGRNAELSRLSSLFGKASILSCERKHVVLDLLLANRSLESSSPSEGSRVGPAECPLIWIFIDMRSVWVFAFSRRFAPTSWCLNGETWFFLQDCIGIRTVVRASGSRLLTTIAYHWDRFVRQESGMVTIWAPWGNCPAARSYISVEFSWWDSIWVYLVGNWVRWPITKLILLVVTGVGRVHCSMEILL